MYVGGARTTVFTDAEGELRRYEEASGWWGVSQRDIRRIDVVQVASLT